MAHLYSLEIGILPKSMNRQAASLVSPFSEEISSSLFFELMNSNRSSFCGFNEAIALSNESCISPAVNVINVISTSFCFLSSNYREQKAKAIKMFNKDFNGHAEDN